MTESEVRQYEKLKIQIDEIYKELSLVSRRKPTTPISSFKLRIVNSLLKTANLLLVGDYKPFVYFDLFDSKSLLPTNSDVVVMLSQYIRCLEKFKYDHVASDSGEWFWIINSKLSKIKTTFPLEHYKM
jgi:hypothetical protein